MAHTCQISGFYTEGCDVQRANRQEKTGFWRFLAVFGAPSAQFSEYIKITLNGSNPHTNDNYMPNFRFLHRRVCRTACGQTDGRTSRYDLLRFFCLKSVTNRYRTYEKGNKYGKIRWKVGLRWHVSYILIQKLTGSGGTVGRTDGRTD